MDIRTWSGFNRARIGRDNELSKDHLIEVRPFMRMFIRRKQGQLTIDCISIFSYNRTKDEIIYTTVCN